MPDHPRDDFAALRQALPDDRFIEFDLNPANIVSAWVADEVAAAWLAEDTHRNTLWLTVHAVDESPAAIDACRELIAAIPHDGLVGGITVPRHLADLLPDALQVGQWSEWDWWYTQDPVHHDGPNESMIILDSVDPRLAQLLDLGSPSAPVRPGDPRCVLWAGIEDMADDVIDTGGLVGMLTALRMASGAAHFNDVTTHPARRGRGVARSLCASATQHLLADGHPAVTLGMYARNDSARRVYQTLGFTLGGRFSSGPL